MTDTFSEYVTLLDEIEGIPVAARASARLSNEQRAATVARVVELVRDRVLPQSDREQAGLEALLGEGLAAFVRPRGASGGVDHETIVAPVDELARADPRDAARVQELLYRLHAAIAGRFGEAELILASAGMEERSPRHGSSARRAGAARPGPAIATTPVRRLGSVDALSARQRPRISPSPGHALGWRIAQRGSLS